MPTNSDESNIYSKLRDKAEGQLQIGATPTAGHWSLGVDALRLLHRLSSNSDSADDALKLLHELQVHQVELDLQHEEIVANEQTLVEDLGLYRALYDCAPFAYFVVDLEGKIIKGNFAATELFGVSLDDMEGQRIDTFLKPQKRAQFLGLIQRVGQSDASESCFAETGERSQGSRDVKFLASLSPEREHILLTCCECAHAE